MPKRLINPVPEMIKGQDWEVREAEKDVYVDLEKRQMVVPLDGSHRSEILRSHELMHVAISPYNTDYEMDSRVNDRTLQSVEDCRIWTELKRVGVDPRTCDVAENERGMISMIGPYLTSKGADKSEIDLEIARLCLARHNTGSEQWVREEAIANGYENSVQAADQVIQRYFDRHGKDPVPFSTVVEACEWLHEYFDPKTYTEMESGKGEVGSEGEPSGQSSSEGEPSESSDSESEEGEGESQAGEEQQEQGEEGEAKSRPEWKEGMDGGQPKKGKNKEGYEAPDFKPEHKETRSKIKKKVSIDPVKGDPADPFVDKLGDISAREIEEMREAGIAAFNRPNHPPSGSMTVDRPALEVRYKNSRGRRKVNTDLGVNPKNLYRATIDQKVFSEKSVRDYGVCILVDCSGSMSLTQDDIEQILDECPAATVAIYASSGERVGYNKEGILRVIVEGKMRLDPNLNMFQGFTGGNVVDEPAVYWLTQRKEERKIWVCDGMVTGIGDQHLCAKGARHIARMVLDNNIIRCDSPRDLIVNKRKLLGGLS